jgi:hypothetical protein
MYDVFRAMRGHVKSHGGDEDERRTGLTADDIDDLKTLMQLEIDNEERAKANGKT